MLYLKHPSINDKNQKLYVYYYAKDLLRLNNLVIVKDKRDFYDELDDFMKIIYSGYDLIYANVNDNFRTIKDEIVNLQKIQKMNNEITPELFEKYYAIYKLQKD